MSDIRDNLKYTTDHEWARIEGGIAVIGITDHAQSELGDIVFVNLPQVGDATTIGESLGTIEAVKTVAEIYSPVSGEVQEINQALSESASVMNQDPYGDGWIAKIRMSKPAELDALLDAKAYAAHIG
ncbi:MAG TPA: glycine cleavage system protein GcvH [Fibrobacteraceae bacterium]|nr:glycine cleavage system protein GcvH [Fibrobacteraceae bacterium]